jgi:hypothetical protein
MYTHAYCNQLERTDMPRRIPLSVRITDDDAAFLARYKAEGATTPSEKLRAILASARKLDATPNDYAGCTEMVGLMLMPAQKMVRGQQKQERLRSDFIARLYERLPELVASLMTGPAASETPANDLLDFEDDIARQTFALIEEILDLGLTKQSRTYDPALIKTQLEPILEILDLIRLSKVKKGDKTS